jgi:UDP-glucose 4-epimerase
MECEAAVGEVFNIGSDQPTTILELANLVMTAIGREVPIVYESYSKAYDEDFEDVRRRVPDLAKLRRFLGFEARATLVDAIRDILEWRRVARRG